MMKSKTMINQLRSMSLMSATVEEEVLDGFWTTAQLVLFYGDPM